MLGYARGGDGVGSGIDGQNYSGDLGPVWYDDVAISTQPLGCI